MENSKELPCDKEKMIILKGPWGGNTGTSWDDGNYDGVSEITIAYNDSHTHDPSIHLILDGCIHSIQVVYFNNGMPVMGKKHGGVGGNNTVKITLNYPMEFLVSASGYYGPVVKGGSNVIRSLKFKSNTRPLIGPYGVEEGTPFNTEEGTPFTIPSKGIVGFMGRSEGLLDAIGFWVASQSKILQKVPETY